MFGSKKNTSKIVSAEEEQEYRELLAEARELLQTLGLPMDVVLQLMIIQRLEKLKK